MISGCNVTSMGGSSASLTGNWSFTMQPGGSNSPQLILNAGLNSQANGKVTAVAHLNGATCVSAKTPIAMSGWANSAGELQLTSHSFGGTTLTIKGDMPAGSTKLTGATITFTGGSCASLGAKAATSTQYAQINGTYSGNFTDQDGTSFPVTSTLTQTTQPDANGTFQLSGSASFPNNPCFTQPIVTDSQVTGDSLSTTYSQGNATITAVGTFNSGATQLTVTNWKVKGGLCDGSYGTGLLTVQ